MKHVPIAICLLAVLLLEKSLLAVSYNRDIRPILAAHCFACHGADEESRKAELRLDQRQDAIDAEAIKPGRPDESELIRRIYSDDEEESMPPRGHPPLSAEQKATLKAWIAQGAEYESHWAFIPPKLAKIPKADREFVGWPKNPIDNFVLHRMRQAGLAPSAEASRYTLIRRLYLDLTGLPPTPAEVRQYIDDESDDAYERLVDRLLDSEHFGEHWSRIWLDLARYADTKGYEKDRHRDIWRYRDWVIGAYNADMPYVQFTAEQLAGDLLPNATSEQILATAFHRNTMTNDEGGTDNEEFRTIAVKDRVDTTMQVWMGLTMGCAKCHSHKYDPISQEEYYQFYAFFNQTEDADRGDEQPKALTPTAEQSARIDRLRRLVDSTAAAIDSCSDDVRRIELERALENQKQNLAAAEKSAAKTPIMRELPPDKQRKTHLHLRGNFLEKGDEVVAAVPVNFGQFPESTPSNRLGVAKWLTQDQNPLTARVAVNRVWARIFGIGLVETEEDFGTQGTYPSHPDLLDFLANAFQQSYGGSHKGLCKLIVMSATYRQASVVKEAATEKDPRNRLLSYAPRYRLSAETVRDQALVAAHLLTREIGGPSVMPPQPDGVWKTTYSSAKWKAATGKNRYRRGLYTYWRRTSPYPSMLTFDAGSREVCMVRRIRTNIPLQALVTMNDPVYVEASGALAKSVLQSNVALNGEDDGLRKQRIQDAFQRVLVRPPTDAEVARLAGMLTDASEEFRNDVAAADELLRVARVHIGGLRNVSDVDLAAWTMVGNVLLNLDETLMRN